jgi:hypothetical protein
VRLTFGGFCVGVVCHLGCMTVRDATTARVVEPVIPARFVWESLRAESADYVSVVSQSVAETVRWREGYDDAKRLACASPGAVETSSLTASAA